MVDHGDESPHLLRDFVVFTLAVCRVESNHLPNKEIFGFIFSIESVLLFPNLSYSYYVSLTPW